MAQLLQRAQLLPTRMAMEQMVAMAFPTGTMAELVVQVAHRCVVGREDLAAPAVRITMV
jgi:hypothetical protein